MYGEYQQFLAEELSSIQEAGLFKRERVITTPQGAEVHVSTGEDVVVMCANNYLGLSSHPEVIKGAKEALDTH
ncbi:MAG: glycine C-acetyltransferase, partial [Flavobacteriales bacterium]|nr:glycine C-acetyltransferase [Flavobacteriales bacterium]